MNIQIKNRFSGRVIFEHDCEDNTIKLTLKLAFESRADLCGANLRDADLRDADLYLPPILYLINTSLL